MVVPDGIRKLALAAAGVPLVAAMTTVMLASPSLAAAQPLKAAAVSPASSGHVYRTIIANLHVRRKPSTSATVVTVLAKAGTAVTVNCYTRGTSVFGDPIWYHITAPHVGYVAGLYLGTGADPAAGIPTCGNHAYRTIIANLHVRRKPSTSATVVTVLAKAGTAVTVNCYTRGTSVFRDNVWYHTVKPDVGYVAGFYLNTGADPAAGVRHC